MTRTVLLSERADRTYRNLPAIARARIRQALLEFASSGTGDLKRLSGTRDREDLHRLRVGDYRVVFALSKSEIRITRIIHRSEGYNWL
ncbi:MAG TPA: type II toxin-antitoxin system RelE/ParE family toxin [Thermoplasmata archaeon]|nr:type II toxin-antitoxin system RelE/ParE family toxin [Thermoplasmata archaeon]